MHGHNAACILKDEDDAGDMLDHADPNKTGKVEEEDEDKGDDSSIEEDDKTATKMATMLYTTRRKA